MQRFPVQTTSFKVNNPEKQNFFMDIVDRTSFKAKVSVKMLKGGCQIEIFDECTPDSAMGPHCLEWGSLNFTKQSPSPMDKRIFKIKGGMVDALRTDPKYSTIYSGFRMPFWRIRRAVGNYLLRNREFLQSPINPKFYDLSSDPMGRDSPIKIICECSMAPILQAHLTITDEWVIILISN